MLLSKRTYKRTHSHPKILEPPHPSLSTVLRKKEKSPGNKKSGRGWNRQRFREFLYWVCRPLIFCLLLCTVFLSPRSARLSVLHLPKSNSKQYRSCTTV